MILLLLHLCMIHPLLVTLPVIPIIIYIILLHPHQLILRPRTDYLPSEEEEEGVLVLPLRIIILRR